jgi:23S rRNA-/tRNA-specific pseudouridylate synthase
MSLLRNFFSFTFSANSIITKPYFAIPIKAMEATSELNLNYPKPISAPPPPISKDIELRRAMEASSKSSLFNLTRDDILYEDEYLMAVNKPKGVYCEAVLRSAPQIVLGE